MELNGKVILVTGGGSGIGAAMCRRFASEDPRAIVVADIDSAAAISVAQEIEGHAAGVDVTDEAAVGALIESVEDRHGPIDLLCNNAGIMTLGSVDVPDVEWQRIWQINVMSHVYTLRAVLPGMLAREEGYLLHTVSAAGLLTNIGAAPYAVTKHAALALAEWIAVTYGDRGIKVSCLCPQFVNTAMLIEPTMSPELESWVREGALEPDEVAEAVMVGLSEERFLILPHPEVGDYFQRKAADYDRWLAGMRRLNASVLPAGDGL